MRDAGGARSINISGGVAVGDRSQAVGERGTINNLHTSDQAIELGKSFVKPLKDREKPSKILIGLLITLAIGVLGSLIAAYIYPRL